MAELLVAADDEVAAVAELTARLDGVHVGTRIPSPLPPEFVRVVGAGGGELTLVSDSFTLALEGFATSEGRARQLCALAIAHLQAAGRAGHMGTAVCYGVTAMSLPANLPMPTVPTHYRFTATVSADLRKVAG